MIIEWEFHGFVEKSFFYNFRPKIPNKKIINFLEFIFRKKYLWVFLSLFPQLGMYVR